LIDEHHGAGTCLGTRRQRKNSDHGYSHMFKGLEPVIIEIDELHSLVSSDGVCTNGNSRHEEAKGDAGWPFWGQYIAHDITADRSPLERHSHGDVKNFRRAQLNLECLYGAGPKGAPYIYDWNDNSLFNLSSSGWDLPRNSQSIAIIADPRNDSHLIVNQLQVSLKRAHNRAVNKIRKENGAMHDVFEAARQQLIWHYQWIIVNEFLPQLIWQELVHKFLNTSLEMLPAKDKMLPYEFADAAYRYGHSQIRQKYKTSPGGDDKLLFPNLLGFRPVSEKSFIKDWSIFFKRNDQSPCQKAMKINGQLPDVLTDLPNEITGNISNKDFKSLANRDLQRGVLTELPSGEAAAEALEITPLSPTMLGAEIFNGKTPLWYYIQKEASVLQDGESLGPLGSHLVGSVLISLLKSDPDSYLNSNSSWAPHLVAKPLCKGETYSIIHLLDFATMPINHSV
jgi:hypothetical protein